MVGDDAVGDIFKKDGLAGPRRGDDQGALPLADGDEDVHDPRGKVFRVAFELELLVGVQRGEVVKEDLVPGLLGPLEVDRVDLQEGEVLLPFLGRPDLAGHGVARTQVEAADLRGGDIDVVGPRQVVVIHGAQEAEPVGQGLQDTFSVDGPVFLGLGLQDSEDEVLAAHAACAGHVEFLGQHGQFIDGLPLDLDDIHDGLPRCCRAPGSLPGRRRAAGAGMTLPRVSARMNVGKLLFVYRD